MGDGAQNNAQIDIITFMNLYYQLSSSDMVIHYTTTVEDQSNAQGVITPTDHSIANIDLLTNFINPIIVYLNAIIAGHKYKDRVQYIYYHVFAITIITLTTPPV